MLFHSWWNGPRVWPVVQSIDPDASHASWLESFPWTRVAGVEIPEGHKQPVDAAAMRVADPATVRELLGDGSYGGDYRRPDADWQAVWEAGVDEVRDLHRLGLAVDVGWLRAGFETPQRSTLRPATTCGRSAPTTSTSTIRR